MPLRARRLVDDRDRANALHARDRQQRRPNVEREGSDPARARRVRREDGGTHGARAPLSSGVRRAGAQPPYSLAGSRLMVADELVRHDVVTGGALCLTASKSKGLTAIRRFGESPGQTSSDRPCFAAARFSVRRSFSVFCAGFFPDFFGFCEPFITSSSSVDTTAVATGSCVRAGWQSERRTSEPRRRRRKAHA